MTNFEHQTKTGRLIFYLKSKTMTPILNGNELKIGKEAKF